MWLFYYICPALVTLLLIFLIIVATRPSTFRVERTLRMSAPPATVFNLLNDFHHWVQWSPWEKMDLTMKKTFEGPNNGPGAIYSWKGNKKVGEGRMTMLSATPNQSLSIKLEFLKPFTATNTAIFTLTPDDSGTRVNWAMEGNRNFIMKAFCLFMDMDKLVGKDFEQGLANLNTASQGVPAA